MPSNKILEAKKAQVTELSEKIKKSSAGVVVKYTGITVDADTKLRSDLRKAGVEYKVYKNSITGRAAEIAGYGGLTQYLTGMTAIAVSEKDPVVAAKILKGFADKIESFEIKGGYVDGSLLDAKGVNNLAETPTKEVLIGRFLGSITGPLYSFAYALQAIVDKSDAPVESASTAEA